MAHANEAQDGANGSQHRMEAVRSKDSRSAPSDATSLTCDITSRLRSTVLQSAPTVTQYSPTLRSNSPPSIASEAPSTTTSPITDSVSSPISKNPRPISPIYPSITTSSSSSSSSDANSLHFGIDSTFPPSNHSPCTHSSEDVPLLRPSTSAFSSSTPPTSAVPSVVPSSAISRPLDSVSRPSSRTSSHSSGTFSPSRSSVSSTSSTNTIPPVSPSLPVDSVSAPPPRYRRRCPRSSAVIPNLRLPVTSVSSFTSSPPSAPVSSARCVLRSSSTSSSPRLRSSLEITSLPSPSLSSLPSSGRFSFSSYSSGLATPSSLAESIPFSQFSTSRSSISSSASSAYSPGPFSPFPPNLSPVSAVNPIFFSNSSPSFRDYSLSPVLSESTSIAIPRTKALPLIASTSSSPSDHNVDDSTSFTEHPQGEALLVAARAGKTEEVRRLLDEGAPANYRGRDQWTALHGAAFNAHANVVAVLLERGADVHARDKVLGSPLHYAPYYDRSGRCVLLLVNAGADVHGRDADGDTPLHDAVSWNNATAVRALVASGASAALTNNAGLTPYDIAKSDALRRILRP